MPPGPGAVANPKRLRRALTSKSPNSQTLFNSLGLVVLFGINFFTMPFFTRVLGPEGYGKFSLYISWSQILTVIIGLQVASTIPVAVVRLGEERLKAYVSSTTTLFTLVFLAITGALWLIRSDVARALGFDPMIVLLLMVHSFGAAIALVVTTYWVNTLQAVRNFVFSVVLAASTIGLSVLLIVKVSTPQPWEARVWGSGIPYAVIGVALLGIILMRGRCLYSREYWAFCLPLCLPLVLHGLAAVALLQIGRILMERLTGDLTAVGCLAVAMTIGSLLQAILNALNNTWVPYFYRELKESTGILAARTANYLRLFTCGTCALILISPEVIRLFAGAAYSAAVPVTPLILCAVFFVFLYLFPVNYELYCRKSSYVSVGTTGAAALSIVLGYMGIRYAGLTGAAVANLISYAALFGFHSVLASRRMNGYPYRMGTFLKPLLAVATVMVVFFPTIHLPVLRWAAAAGFLGFLAWRLRQTRTIF